MAFGALMVFVTRRSDRVSLWLAGFLACIAASFFIPGAQVDVAALLALPFLAAFTAELRPSPRAHRAAIAFALAGIAAAALDAVTLAQVLAVALAAWTTSVAAQLVRE